MAKNAFFNCLCFTVNWASFDSYSIYPIKYQTDYVTSKPEYNQGAFTAGLKNGRSETA